MNMPSRTSQAVALTRAGLRRPHSTQGDPDSQRKLCRDMQFSPPAWLVPSIAARTRFVDAEVTEAIEAGLRQVVTCGAGYDDRALRFRTSGVRFFELDHPATQADKARLLRALGEAAGSADGGGEGAAGGAPLTLAAADFSSDDAGEVLARAGHDARQPTLFVCEGLLVYLDEDACRRLLTALAARAAPGSRLVVSIATHAEGFDSAEVVAAANLRRRTAAAEPWRTILPPAEHLALVEQSGWTVTATQWSPVAAADVSHGRRSLLVAAVVCATGPRNPAQS
jgi:methyltransferase (TIGR00027 family)